MLLHTGNCKSNIGAVGADLHTVFTIAAAGETSAAVRLRHILLCQIPLAVRNGFLIRQLKQILSKSFSKDCLRRFPAVPDTFYYCSWPEEAVACCVHTPDGSFQRIRVHLRTFSGIQGNAVCLIETGWNLLTYGRDHRVCGNLYDLIRLCNAPAAACIQIAQNHFFTVKHAIFLTYRRKEFCKLDAVLKGHCQFLLIRRHIAPRSSVYQRNLLYPCIALCSSCCIHSRISSADDGYIFAQLCLSVCCLKLCQKFQSVNRLACLKPKLAGLRSAQGQNHIIIFLLKRFYGLNLFSVYQLCSHGLYDLDIPVNGAVRDAESRYHIAYHAAHLGFLLKYSYLHASPGQEKCRCQTCRAASYYGSLLVRGNRWGLKILHHCLVTAFCGLQLGSADIDRCFIEISGTLAHTVVSADSSCNKRQRILI